MSTFAYLQLRKDIEEIVNGNVVTYKPSLSHYANSLSKNLDIKLSSNIKKANVDCINIIENDWLTFEGIKEKKLSVINDFFEDILKLEIFLKPDTNYKLSDHTADLLSNEEKAEINTELISMYTKYLKLDINDIIAVYMLYSKHENKSDFREIARKIINNPDCLPIKAAEKFRRKNIEYLKKYPYIQPDLLQADISEKVLVRIENNIFFTFDPNYDQPIEKYDIPITEEVDYTAIIESGYICQIEDADALCSSLPFYLERAKKGDGNTPIKIVFDSSESFFESLNYIDYTDILENERYVISIKGSNFEAENYSAKCNLEFLFKGKTRICGMANGFNDQLRFYLFAKKLEKEIGGDIFFDDIFSFYYRNHFNGKDEIEQTTTENINGKFLSQLFSEKLLEYLCRNYGANASLSSSLPSILYKNNVNILSIKNNGDPKPYCPNIEIKTPGKQFDYKYLDLFKNVDLSHWAIFTQLTDIVSDDFAISDYIEFPKFQDNKNIEIEEKMLSSDAVVLHIRRGDYIPHLQKANHTDKGYIDYNFYVEAIQGILKINDYPNKKYFVFSDEIPWCKSHKHELGLDLVGDSEIIFVDHNKGSDSFKDMQLMLNGKIFIISHSGLARNAALLSERGEIRLCYNLDFMKAFEQMGQKNKYDITLSKTYNINQLNSTTLTSASNASQANKTNNIVMSQNKSQLLGREYVEWMNFWFDRGNEQRDDRILLVGDSISRDYRPFLSILTNRPVDFFASTASISDEKFYETLELFFSYKEYRQKKAQIQIGVHGIDGVEKAIQSNSISDYEKGFERLVTTVLKYIPDLTIALTTSIVQANDLSKLDDKINNEIIKRNQVAKKIAEKYKLPINDLYTLMLNEPHRDWVHFTKEGSEKIARQTAKVMKLI